MRNILVNKLHEYIRQNNPDVLIPFEEESSTTQYLKDKVEGITDLLEQLKEANTPAYIIEDVCMEALTKDLKPSKFNYICAILEEDFKTAYHQLQESGILRYEVVNMIADSKPVFDSFGFTEKNEDNRHLRYAVTGSINEYLSKNQ
jgi:hypothetical protein